MGRARGLAALMGVGAALLVALMLPAAASAGTYTWDLNSNFTATAPGANPDHDAYGGAPWTYEEGGGTLLPTPFDPNVDNGLAGWHDSGNVPLVAINPTASPITNTGSTYLAGQVVMQPSLSAPAVVAWTSPLTGNITVSGSTNADAAGTPVVCPNADWDLLKNGGSTGPGGSGTGSGTISKALAVNAGDRISLSVSVPGVALNAGCSATSATLTITSASTAPTVILATPANGATISGGQPTFSGTADAGFGALSTVRVKVYSGTSATGMPIQTIDTTRSGTSFSTGPSAALADGTYTAQAEQSNLLSETGHSQPTTFHLQNAAATVTLDSLGTKPVTTATPTFTGVAAHSKAVSVAIYPGTTANGTPVQTAGGTSGADGHFSVTPGQPLGDGQYTAVARDAAGGVSNAMPFRVKVHPPALTVSTPASGARTSDSQPTFAGTGGAALGDSSRVSVTVFSGASSSGKSLGSAQATVTGGRWTLRWAQALKLGTYSFQASQSDDAGHTTTVRRSFVIGRAPNVIGSSVSVSRRGVASVPISCTAPGGHVCTGHVLVLTVKSYRTVPGGPAGKIRVMFAYVSIPGGTTQVVKRKVQADALRALRHLRGVHAKVITTLKDSGGPAKTVSAQRSIRLASH